jgi:hypothetical protein
VRAGVQFGVCRTILPPVSRKLSVCTRFRPLQQQRDLVPDHISLMVSILFTGEAAPTAFNLFRLCREGKALTEFSQIIAASILLCF